MTPRLTSLLALCLVFGSMWLNGGVVFDQGMDEMDMEFMGSTCLEYCLSSVHTNTADNALAGVALSFPTSEIEHWGQVVNWEFSWAPSVDSHHDPSRILTTVKRE